MKARLLAELVLIAGFGAGGADAPAQSPPARQVTKVVGEGQKLLLMSDGTLLGSRPRSAALVAIALPGKAVDVAAGYDTFYALLDDGTVRAWGQGDEGQLGIGPSVTSSETPVKVSGLAGVVQIVAMADVALALLKDGTVRAWGSRAYGMVGDGLDPHRYLEQGPNAPFPVRVPNVSGITKLAAGGGFVLALGSNGRVFSWGSNQFGALGRPPRQELPMDAVGEIPGLTDVIMVAGGNVVATALKKDGTVWVWGSNSNAQFGNGEQTGAPSMDSGYELVPQRVPGVTNVVAISLGHTGRHTLVLLKDGTLRGWGNTDWGQIGAGVSNMFQEKPVIPRITGVKAVFAVGNNSFAVRTDGTFWGWGSGDPREWPFQKNTKVPTLLVLP